ncbi:MAG: lipoprotein [Hyphomicrobium sp.]
MSSFAKKFGLALILAVSLAGCGVRGSLETPQAAKNDATADANSGQGKSEADAPKKHEGFVLDGLLR